jgi:hypothetical protein
MNLLTLFTITIFMLSGCTAKSERKPAQSFDGSNGAEGIEDIEGIQGKPTPYNDLKEAIHRIKNFGKTNDCDLTPTLKKPPQKVVVTVDDCKCEPPPATRKNAKPKPIILPPSHPLKKKFGIDLVLLSLKKNIAAIETSVSTTNDNHQGFLISPRFYLESYRSITNSDKSYDGTPVMGLGDDSGNTYAIDANAKVTFINGIRMKTSVGTRLYSRSADGYVTPSGSLKLIDAETKQPIDFDGKLDDLKAESAQKSLSLTELKIEVEIPAKKFDYGFTIGSKTLDDTPSGTASSIQKKWHDTIDIYTFDNQTFERMIVDGMHRYLTLGGEIGKKTEAFRLRKCVVTASAKAGFVANVPVTKNAFRLNTVQPYAKADLVIGMGKALHDPSQKRYEFVGGITLDPWNQTPEKRDMGTFGMADAGFRWNIAKDRHSSLSIVPIHLYFPLSSKSSRQNDLMDGKPMIVNGHTIQQEDIQREILADWFVVTYKRTFKWKKK